jgi:hypothetical protein
MKKAVQEAAEEQVHAPEPGSYSPAVEQVIDRIASSKNYLEENFIQLMTESEKLAEEPEFLDLEFNVEKTATVTERLLHRYETKLLEAEKQGPEQFSQMYDEVRIEIIRELATPLFKKQVKEGLAKLFTRLAAGEDLQKLELVIALQAILSTKELPWGVNGLILAIYNRTIQTVLGEVEAETELDEAIAEIVDGKSEEEIAALLQSPEELHIAAEKLLADNPELLEETQKQALEMVANFEEALFKGEIVLDLFSQAELDLPFDRLEQETGRAVNDILTDEGGPLLAMDAVREDLVKIMTPERIAAMRQQASEIGQAWFEQRHEWAGALELEQVWLEGDEYEENKFLVCVFFGQLIRADKDSE